MVEGISERCLGRGKLQPIRQWPEGEFKGYQLDGSLPPLAAVQQCLAELDAISGPCDDHVRRQELAKLGVRTAPRPDREGEGGLRAAAYLDLLSPYPTDVVIWACNIWVRGPVEKAKWFPTWAELHDLLETRNRRRAALAAICRSMLVALGQPVVSNAHPDEA